ncbi:hypothetical protein PS6_008983 [Mucor atramentarius]
MVVNLYERSLADFMFVSPMDNANTPFSLRDIDCDMSVIRQLKNIQKQKQSLLSNLRLCWPDDEQRRPQSNISVRCKTKMG